MTTYADSPHGAVRPSARTTIATHGPLGPGRAATGVRAVIGAARDAPLVPVAILGGLMLVAILADLIAPHDPTLPVKGANVFDPPFWMEGGRTTTLLGTDFQGRDVLSRLIHGTRVSLIVGLMGTLVAGGIGTAMGILSGYVGRWVDQVIMRVTDAWLAEARPTLMAGQWWLTVFPGLCILLIVLATQLFGDWLRVRLDPQLRNL